MAGLKIRQTRRWGSPGWTHRETYESLTVGALSHRARRRGILKMLRSIPFQPSGDLADFGCSDGYILEILSKTIYNEATWNFYGFDRKRALIDAASAKAPPNFKYEHVDLNHPTEHLREKFDVVTMLGTIEHTGDWKTATTNVLSASRPGGHVLITVPHEMGWRGVAKFYGRKVFQANPYGNFFDDKSEFHYVKKVLTWSDVESYREPPASGWGHHLGFNIRLFEDYVREQFLQTGEYSLLVHRSTFMGFDRLYLFQRAR